MTLKYCTHKFVGLHLTSNGFKEGMTPKCYRMNWCVHSACLDALVKPTWFHLATFNKAMCELNRKMDL